MTILNYVMYNYMLLYWLKFNSHVMPGKACQSAS